MEDIFIKLAELRNNRREFVVATVVAASMSTPRGLGAKMAVMPDGSIYGTIGGGGIEKKVIADALKMFGRKDANIKRIVYDLDVKKRSENNVLLGMLCGGQAEVLFEYFPSDLDLVICGAGHIGEKLAQFADLNSWSYAVVDNRPEFANRERFSGAVQVSCGDFAGAIAGLETTQKTAFIIVTYGHIHDHESLKAAIKKPAYYIGMIGSRQKVGKIFAMLKKEGIKIPGNVYSPVGLDIGSDTPAEIAISIFSEILKVKTGTTGKSMRDIIRRS